MVWRSSGDRLEISWETLKLSRNLGLLPGLSSNYLRLSSSSPPRNPFGSWGTPWNDFDKIASKPPHNRFKSQCWSGEFPRVLDDSRWFQVTPGDCRWSRSATGCEYQMQSDVVNELIFSFFLMRKFFGWAAECDHLDGDVAVNSGRRLTWIKPMGKFQLNSLVTASSSPIAHNVGRAYLSERSTCLLVTHSRWLTGHLPLVT